MNNRKNRVSILMGVLTAALLFGLLSGLAPRQASAASSSEIKVQIRELKEEKEALEEMMKNLEGQIKENSTEIKAMVEKKNIIDQEVFLLHGQVTNINEQIGAFNVLIADKQDELDAAQANLNEMNEQMKDRIRTMEEDGKLSYWSVLFKASSFTDLLDRMNMIEEIAASDQRRLNQLREAANLVATAKQELMEEKQSLEDTKKELHEAQALLEEKCVEAAKLLSELIAKGDEYEALLEAGEQAQEDLAKDIAKAEKEYNAAKYREWLATSVPPTTKPPPTTVPPTTAPPATEPPATTEGGSTEETTKPTEPPVTETTAPKEEDKEDKPLTPADTHWRSPLTKSTKVTSAYGWRIHPVYNVKKFHHGIDLNAKSGDPIVAARSGVVTRTTYDSSSGYYVTINHGDGFSSSYLHMTHYCVKPGQNVNAGDVIGYVGSTGTSTGPHLHFAIYFNGNSVNPASYVNF